MANFVNKIGWSLVIVVMATGCVTNSLSHIEFIALPEANQQKPTAIDLVFVYDQALAQQIKSLTGKQWFSQRSAFISTYAAAIDTVSMELVPGMNTDSVSLPSKHASSVGVFVFANFIQPGKDKVILTDISSVRITILENDLEIYPAQ